MCGAGDTEVVRRGFVALAERMGFEPWSYLDGSIRYRNAATAGWRENSRGSLLEADIAVFVVIRRYGEIAWTEEFPAAIEAGLPMVVLCLDATLSAYRAWQLSGMGDVGGFGVDVGSGFIAGTGTGDIYDTASPGPTSRPGDAYDGGSPSPEDSVDLAVFTTLEELEQRYQVTVVPFRPEFFAATAQQHISLVLEQATGALRDRNAREIERALVLGAGDLNSTQIEAVTRVVRDELEDKNLRKRGIDALVRHHAIADDLLIELAGSLEQGVARKMLTVLPEIADDVSGEALAAVVAIANDSDDVGISRRLALALAAIGPPCSLITWEQMTIQEVGTARRVLDGLVALDPRQLSREQCAAVRRIAVNCRDYRPGSRGLKDLANATVERFTVQGEDVPAFDDS